MANIGDLSSGTSAAQVTLAAPGAGMRWYLLDVSMKSDTACDFTVQSPASTNKFKHSLSANEGYEKTWAKPGLAGGENEALIINVSAGTYNINYQAVVR